MPPKSAPTSTEDLPSSSVSFQRSSSLPKDDALDRNDFVKPQNFFQILFLAKNSYFSGTFSLANTTIGAGVLLLPYVFKTAGIILGVILLFIAAILSALTLHLIHMSWIKVQQFDSKRIDYEDLGDYLYGKWMGYLVKLSVLIINFGACISYLIIMNHLILPVILFFLNEDTAKILEDSDLFSAAITIILSIPGIILSCLPSIGDLRFFSYISTFSMIFFVIMVIIGLITNYNDTSKSGTIRWFSLNWDLVPLLGVVTLAFACHTNMCSIVREFGPKQSHRVSISVFGNGMICFITFMLIGICGYLTFLDHTCSDIVQSYSSNSPILIILRILLTFSLILTYPMSAYPARITIRNTVNDFLNPKKLFYDSIKCCEGARAIKNHKPNEIIDIFPKNISESDSESNDSEDSNQDSNNTEVEQFPKGIFYRILRIFKFSTVNFKELPKNIVNFVKRHLRNSIEGLFIGLTSLLIAIFFPYASTLFGIVGSTGSTMATFLIPSLYYYACYRPTWKNPRFYILILLFIFGIAFGITVTSVSVYHVISGDAKSKEKCK